MTDPVVDHGRQARMVAIHPAVILGVVWAFAFPAWYFASDKVLAASISGERAGSVHAFLFFAGCLAAFATGSLLAGLAWPSRKTRALVAADYPGINLIAVVSSATVLAGGAVWLLRIMMAVGSPMVLLDLFLSGHSVAELKYAVFIPAQLPPFTTMVHLAPAAASMLLVQRKLNGWTRIHWFLMLGLVALAIVRTLVLAERFAGLGLMASVCITLLLTTDRLRPRRVFMLSVSLAALLWFVWSAGEFSRSWMDSRDGDSTRFTVSNFRASLSYSQDRLGAYLFTAINNGVIIVDEWPDEQFPVNFMPVLARAGVPGLTGEEGAGDLYTNELSREFTGESMPGKFYLDARDLGIVLALVYGAIFGLAWRAASLASPAGIVLYAALSHVLIDSYRSAYLFDLQGVAGFAGAALVLIGASRLKGRRPLGHPARPQLRASRRQHVLLNWSRRAKPQVAAGVRRPGCAP
jgi:hypothetical protein